MERTFGRAAVVAGLGGALPRRVVTNDELVARLDTTDAWIRSRTGIVTRRWAGPATTTGDLAVRAAANALDSAGGARADAVVLATTTPDRRCPATAPRVAKELRLTGAAAFDVAAVCAGFVYALAVGHALIAAGTVESVLVVAAETFSRILDPDDRSTVVIFGDGAGAVLLRAGDADEPGAVLTHDLGSDGSRSEAICIPAGSPYFTMQGREVYASAVRSMYASCRKVLRTVEWKPVDVDALVPHQANRRIIDALAERLGVPGGRVVSDIDEVGNTSAASIPLALAHGIRDGRLQPGARVLLTAFGGGLAWGSTALTWPRIRPVVTEYDTR